MLIMAFCALFLQNKLFTRGDFNELQKRKLWEEIS